MLEANLRRTENVAGRMQRNAHAADGELMAFRHTGFWRPVDTLRDKRQLEDLWQTGAPWKVWA